MISFTIAIFAAFSKGLLFRQKVTGESARKIENKIKRARIELTRDASFLEGQHDIFDVLADNEGVQESLKSSISQTISVLDEAEDALGDAERKIASLEQLSAIDETTGFLNRKGFTKALLAEVARTNRGHNDGGLLILFCIENYHHIQDQYGSGATDRALALIAKAMDNEIRPMDWAGRVNEDEFVLLFTNTDMQRAVGRLQNMALRLNKLSLIWQGTEISLSLSLGLKSFEQGDDAMSIFKFASADLHKNRKGHYHA